ncbi:murein DD-endopeptidase MepM/ murein hydrolase activator NlpD [Rhizobium leguminosarum]|uniref:M23 family metallopeptidase n=1 Tax=Rhizobium leguminosarum TaxID=384 RepID=UPI001AE48375|nr:M23 family metallopeptidase [Rhizobium leguminosarum]MBP2490881.1 murein DD-endopeptidase MepM/ murein hydrolase activator NlpD [Rhizobium leguminosarum]
MMRRSFCAAFIFSATQIAGIAHADNYSPPGELEQDSGSGYRSSVIFRPSMRFPIDDGKAFANSQVYRAGGMYGSGGGQCDAKNYAYPWRDNFCEKRSRATPMCPSGQGHQGQDIRPGTCKASLYWAVAAENGIVTNIGSYSVTIQGSSGAIFRYLHLDMRNLRVKALDKVSRGEKIGQVSNFFNGTPTTIHLHFEIKQAVVVNGTRIITFVPPYTSLVAAHKALLAGTP